ncbi:spore germination protein PE [Halobacillus alkaliphilus]|uniref:Spore germination protein PE n=1 Tax=Halobacillus alkaliphilus TaxID=396056 RepID=A0A1I2NHG7_9BACI|nr:spore germination protein GerPE [Halobacillus alkaliphilus]SFG00906.1 spore germination protein PE [Halobacillus alkaliphilus]
MYNRMVYVDEIDITSALISSHFSIGDVHRASPWSKVLAVQKEGSEFVSDTFNFEDFPIFSLQPTSPLPPITISSFHYQNQAIYVNDIHVTGVSTSGIVQVGGIEHIDSISRTKHIRVLSDEQ